MGGGGKIPYPKHVWSPAGGWYGQPKNWKTNTVVAFAVVFGISAIFFRISAERETRYQFPEPGRFFPSRKSVAHNASEVVNANTGQLVAADNRARKEGRALKESITRRIIIKGCTEDITMRTLPALV